MDIVQAFLDIALLGSAWVLWLLLILSVVSIAIIIERYKFFSKTKIDYAEFRTKVLDCLIDQKWDEAKALCQNKPGVEAQVLLRGFEKQNKGTHAMDETMSSYLIGEKQNLDRGLVVLGTLGNNAPFIGLFGTVIGIIAAFNSLSQNTAGGPSVVMAGISEALVATAVGLIVAIPAVIAFNTFNRIVKSRLANAQSMQKMLIANTAKN